MTHSDTRFPLLMTAVMMLLTAVLFPAFPSSAQDNTAAQADSTAEAADGETTGVDTTISYAANSIEFFVDQKKTILRGNARVEYKGMILEAEKITVAWDEDLIIAEGVQDTIWVDSAKTEVDTVITRGKPVFTEGDQKITGARMLYNLKTRRGKITEGFTSYSDGFYWGANIKKEPDEVLYVGPGSFTTCEKKEPHYCFYSYRMKIIRGDKVVAEPIVLYFGEVPVAAIPYGVFPARRGRHSGIVVPTYGETGSQGRFIRHLGYYWAPNEYTDLTGTLDYYEESGFLFHALGRYNWRYHLSGSLNGSFIRQHFGSQKKRRWELKWGHDQVFSPDTRLRINANIISDGSYYQDYSFNINEQLSQTLRSDATLSHTFPGTKNSYTINLHHEQNLLNDEISQSIPRVTFRHGQSAIFSPPKRTPGDTAEVETRWYHNLYYSYSGEALHQRVLDETITATDTSLVQHRRSAAKHSINFNSPQKIFKYFSLTPSLNYREDWFDEWYDYTQDPNGIRKNGFAARRTFTSSLGLSTKLYGFWTPPIPGVEAIRHTMTPNLSLNYRPDFSDSFWGYYQEVEQGDGSIALKDRFAGSLYGNTPKGKQMALGYSVQNLFQMKYGSGEEEKKRDLFTVNLSGSYNFAADSLKFAPLRTSFRASPISRDQALGPLESFSFDLTTTHSFYKYGNSGIYDELYFDPERGRILRLLSLDISADTKLSIGTLAHPREEVLREGELTPETAEVAVEEAQPDTTGSLVRTLSPKRWFVGQVPWDLRLSFHYTTNRSNPFDPSETFWMNAAVDASLTRNWQLSYNTRVDLIEGKVITAGLTVYRDMHCWEARFVWNPLGIAQGYYLKINVKSSALQDIKVERRRGQGSFMGF